MAFGSNPVDLFSRQDSGVDLDFVQNTFISRRPLLQWKPRVMAQEAVLAERTPSEMRRILFHNQTFESVESAIGDSAIRTGRLVKKASRNGGVWPLFRMSMKPA